jgi:putative DNA primase/helicase
VTKDPPSKHLRDLAAEYEGEPDHPEAAITLGDMPGDHGRILPADSAWRLRLCTKEVKQNGDYIQIVKAIAANVATILIHDDRWAGVLAYDEFAETVITTRPPPWRQWDAPSGGSAAGDWNDADTARLKMWFSTEYKIDMGTADILDGIMVAAHRNVVHPVREWLESLKWDGVRRVPTWLVDIMGCDDTPYVRAVGQAWAISAVARAYKPGCKVDTVLVLEGKPGTFKSSVLRALVGDEWFLEMAITDVSNKDALQILRRKWIAEFPEIDGLSRHEQAAVKSYFSRQVDTYRPSYGRGSRDYPRQTVFAATTNKSEWLTDETGGTGRRMWPVKCRKGDVSLARAYRDNFWAEAKARLECGEAWHIMDPDIIDAERAEQDARFRTDPWEETIGAWLNAPSQIGSRASLGVTTTDILAGPLAFDVSKRDNFAAARVGAILRRIGWAPGNQEIRNGARVRLYRPIGSNIDAEVCDEEPSREVVDLMRYRESESEQLAMAGHILDSVLE